MGVTLGFLNAGEPTYEAARKSSQDKRLAERIKKITNSGKSVPVSALPLHCQAFAQSGNCLDLPQDYHAAYVEAMQMFAALETPFGKEALTALGQSFQCNAYPELDSFYLTAKTSIQKRTVRVLSTIGEIYGTKLPSAFYQVILQTAFADDDMFPMFKDEELLMQDRIMDAALHAVLLVTPVSLHIQSVFSQEGLRFNHVMACSCWMEATNAPSFDIPAPEGEVKLALLQNVIAATLEQYGVNAVTMPK
ncbi:MAG: hypothetical protein VX730_07395 [Pseudomonadota bacterium]|nr:hypothetical protein [Pseudomonadota bacterium]